MKLMFDTANLKDIAHYMHYYPICGITSNPSILKEESNIDFFEHLNKIRSLISYEKALLVQVVSQSSEKMVAEAEKILDKVDSEVSIKIPVSEQGLKAIIELKKKAVNITATAIYTKEQGFLAIMAGADYIAPYCNRMEVLDISFEDNISSFRAMIDKYKYKTEILAASFKNIAQVNKAFVAGAHIVTLKPELLSDSLENTLIKGAIDAFEDDWKHIHGEKGILDL